MRIPIAISLALLAIPAAARKPAPPPDLGEIILDRADPAIDATVAGVPARLAVMLDDGTNLTPAFAARVPLEWRDGGYQTIGRVRLRYREAAADVTIAERTGPIRVQTQDGPCCRGHDGSIGATSLPWSTVRIGTAAGLPERRYPAESDERTGLSIPWKIGRETIHVVLAPDAPQTVASASAAAILARNYGGQLADAVRDAPIAFGIARPVRDLVFARPATLLGFTLDRIATRIGDYAGDDRLPQPAVSSQPGEILVKHRPPPPQFRLPLITIGRDLLDRCPAIAVYTLSAEIGLSCGG